MNKSALVILPVVLMSGLAVAASADTPRAGVTAILPRQGDSIDKPVLAGVFSLNGNVDRQIPEPEVSNVSRNCTTIPALSVRALSLRVGGRYRQSWPLFRPR